MVRQPLAPTIKTLQSLLTRIGSATSGKKDVLLSRLKKDLEIPSRIPSFRNAPESTRIVSIDMGIKNLAFCVADIDTGSSLHRKTDGTKDAGGIGMSVQAWRRLNVADEVEKEMLNTSTAKNGSSSEEVEDAYTPSALARTAYTLLTKTLLPYKPDVILIEKQRWRSGGGAAIQQWTVRVNTLEGMLWAILTALRDESRPKPPNPSKAEPKMRSYEIFGVDPKRVGHFWIGDEHDSAVQEREWSKTNDVVEGEVKDISITKRKASKPTKAKKAEKVAKINVLKSWLTRPIPAVLPSTSSLTLDSLGLVKPNIRFSFSKDAEATREALCTEKASGGRRKKVDGVTEIKKLDDITDCFLQAAAWVAWEQNRVSTAEEWNNPDGGLCGLFCEDKAVDKEQRPKRKGKEARK